MEFRHLSPEIGVEVTDVDAKTANDKTFSQLYDAWCRHGVLLLRGQDVDGPALARFSRRFGKLEPPPASERSTRDGAGSDEAPEVWLISNVIEDGKPIGSLGAGEAEWHTDMSYLEEPPTASILYACEVPPSGGNTWFASMAAAYANLPAGLREKIEGRLAKHNSSYTSAGELRRGAAEVTDVSEAPGVEHPIVRTHPETGQPSIFLGRRRNGYVVGMDVQRSDALLDEIWGFCTEPRFAYEHAWRVGDLLIWDNRSVIHRRDAFDPAARRVLMRTQVKGERPY